MNTNNVARKMRRQLSPPASRSTTHQWGYVAAVHPKSTTTLHLGCTAGDITISTVSSVAANSYIVVGSGGPVQVQIVAGSGPYTLTLVRGVPTSQSPGATVRVIPTVDVYLDGFTPGNVPAGTLAVLTTGVRFFHSYSPSVGHVVVMGRMGGLATSDRFVMDRLAT